MVRKKANEIKYYVESGIHTIKCSPSEFKLVLIDQRKKNIDKSTYTNANFFGNYSEKGEPFTLPAGHLIAKYEATSKWEKHYCQERGKFIGDKFIFDAGKWSGDKQFYDKDLTTFYIQNGKSYIDNMKELNTNYTYAVSGVPVMRNGNDVKFKIDVIGEGYNASVLYATKHIFIGLKKNDNNIYIMGYKTKTSNLIYSAEMYKKLKALNYYDVIKLDGGGSYHFEVNNQVKDTMSENRRISAIIQVDNIPESETDINTNKDEPSSWAKKSWEKAKKKEIVDGISPQGNVSREQLTVILDKLNLL